MQIRRLPAAIVRLTVGPSRIQGNEGRGVSEPSHDDADLGPPDGAPAQKRVQALLESRGRGRGHELPRRVRGRGERQEQAGGRAAENPRKP